MCVYVRVRACVGVCGYVLCITVCWYVCFSVEGIQRMLMQANEELQDATTSVSTLQDASVRRY